MIKQPNYQPPQSDLWQGRKTVPEQGLQYWYQAIQCIDLNITMLPSSSYSIIGYACEAGVRRNQGRVGTVQGPDQIRKMLATVAFHHGETAITDLGNMYCIDDHLEVCQEAFAQLIKKMLSHQTVPIGLGGGHDMAYASLKGILDHFKVYDSSSRLGIINFDAHFDLRPVINRPNSGTPFNQIMQSNGEQVSYLPVGIQKAANTSELFRIADELDVKYIPIEACSERDLTQVKQQISTFIEQQDYIYLSVDLDGFSSAFAPGVSAPSPIGFTPHFFFAAISPILESRKLISVDIAELNPLYDQDGRTASLAARVIDYLIENNART